ncbi:unnamed protein product [Rhizoctonia solani]|uniref:Uncharacterized protein n=1 Tax=Rhizoctonia solani TaxID=456999 RepID=A0A8H3GSB1_9AGAM|nr:unnamed protein product [Rhizoctonia solani]
MCSATVGPQVVWLGPSLLQRSPPLRPALRSLSNGPNGPTRMLALSSPTWPVPPPISLNGTLEPRLSGSRSPNRVS